MPTTASWLLSRPTNRCAETLASFAGSSPFARVLLGCSAARLLGVHEHHRAWQHGADGEHAARWLGRLPDRWHLFHDIPVPARGRASTTSSSARAVFTANAKNLTGRVGLAPRQIRHNGHPTNFLTTSVAEARRASRLLSATVSFGRCLPGSGHPGGRVDDRRQANRRVGRHAQRCEGLAATSAQAPVPRAMSRDLCRGVQACNVADRGHPDGPLAP